MENVKWREDADAALVAETIRFRLEVHNTACADYVRFLVWARHGFAANRLLGSGAAANLGQGMKAAQSMADRFLGVTSLAIEQDQGSALLARASCQDA